MIFLKCCKFFMHYVFSALLQHNLDSDTFWLPRSWSPVDLCSNIITLCFQKHWYFIIDNVPVFFFSSYLLQIFFNHLTSPSTHVYDLLSTRKATLTKKLFLFIVQLFCTIVSHSYVLFSDHISSKLSLLWDIQADII